MSCGSCGTENPAGASFCMACGARLERRCASCGAAAPPEARFCMSCGSQLDQIAATSPPVPRAAEQPPEERRQVTVLFADLSGYTAVAERMDPEAVKALVDRALMRLGQEVERYGGTVDKYIGDNVMAIFGAPIAHEDDAERAVRAGLGMQAAMGEINEGLPSGVHFDLRVGVNTGEVMAGAVGASYTVTGDTVNVAARLQSAARPGSVTVGERTMRATVAAVRYDELAPLTLKGKSEPVPACEAEHPQMGEEGERRTALLGRLIGLEVPPELVPETDDPERMRDAFFSALRSGVEAWAREKPLVFAFEDIHWADDGMLDAIEHLAQWVRAPLLIVCLARDELLDRRPGWGGGRRSATQLILDPLGAADTESLVACLLPDSGALVPAVVERSGGNPLFAEEMARRIAEEGGHTAELPDTVQAVLAARLDALEPFERRLVQQAAVVGRTFWEGSLMPLARSEGRDLGRALTSLQEKDILAPGAEGRLAGERELAFKHVLIRDVAYGMLPKSVRARKHFEVGSFIEDRAGDRIDEVGPLLAEHYGRAAALGHEGGLPPDELHGMQRRAMLFLERAGDAGAQLFSNRESASHYRHARKICPRDAAGDMARIGEKLGDVSLRLGRVDEAIGGWLECLEWHRGQEDLERVADLHRKIGAALSHKGERKPAIEHYQKGINLLKDGPPRIELVRLYEEAAWLYLHTGDNMLAIYASEKALRLAERLGETRAASPAHGIFGRVFGRIGDNEKARENLERAVDLARGAEPGETILALAALGRHLETAEADAGGALVAYGEGLELAEQVGDLPNQVELHAAVA